MKLSKYILIFTISLCMAAQCMALSEICVGPDHTNSAVDWASHCHTQPDDSHHSHKSSFGHKNNDCIDISITSSACSNSISASDDPLIAANPMIIKPATADHPFFSYNFSKLKNNLFPVFTDMTPLSIKSTILNI
jgi:hypothetical protein